MHGITHMCCSNTPVINTLCFFFLFKHRNKCMIVCLRKSKPQINVIFLKDKPICCPFPSLQLLISLLSNCCCVIMQNISLSLSSPTFVSSPFFTPYRLSPPLCLWCHSQGCCVCQEDLIKTIRQHVCSSVLMRSITSITIMLWLPPVRRLETQGEWEKVESRCKKWICVGVWQSVCVHVWVSWC